jgi:hypothetical protein
MMSLQAALNRRTNPTEQTGVMSLTLIRHDLRLGSLSVFPGPAQIHVFLSGPESRAEGEMLEQLQTWWENASLEVQAALQFAGVVVGALVTGQILGVITDRVLSSRNFDAALRLPRASPPDPEGERGFTPTFVAGLLMRLSIWAAAAWWLAQKYGRTELSHTLGVVINRTWAIATILVASLALGRLVASRLIACLGEMSKPGPQAGSASGRAAAPRVDAAGAVGAGVYVLVLLLVLIIAADLFDWPLTRASAEVLWQFTQRLFVACAALSIGCMGASWARDMVTLEGTASPEQRAGQYTALGIVAATTVLAVSVLLSSAGVLIGLASLAVVGMLLWLVRGYLPDIAAGLQLRVNKVDLIQMDGERWQVVEVGLLTTEVSRRGECRRLSNRLVQAARLVALDARLASQPTAK